MAAISKISNSLVSGVNENNFGLGYMNIDFSLIRVNVPKEYLPIAKAMSLERRDDAENGPLHQTARILGGLFYQLAPTTPKVIEAFGRRTSEIMEYPGTIPTGTASDGPFREYVGIDAGSIWASVTSGDASISVLLLACMIARKADDPKVAIAIWDEIITVRQAAIVKSAEANGMIDSSVAAAKRRIPREDIAAFDASIRSWLGVADQVMFKSHKKLRLILDNLQMPEEQVGRLKLYDKVINAWTAALQGFESLLAGQPQTVSDTSLLLALSAWHLYPSLIVLTPSVQKVDFGDALIPPSAIITVGLVSRPADDASAGFRWSIVLSHLRYYGDPVQVDVDDNSRISLEELEMIHLGAIFARWGLKVSDTLEAARWICLLHERLKAAIPNEVPTWLLPLNRAASAYVSAKGLGLQLYDASINCGRRRSDRILPQVGGQAHVPFFGLANSHVIRALAVPTTREATILYARSIGTSGDLPPTETFLGYCQYFDHLVATVLTTVIPHERFSNKRDRNDDRLVERVHARWVSFSMRDDSDTVTSSATLVLEHLRRLQLPVDEEIYVLPGDKSALSLSQGDILDNSYWRNAPSLFPGQWKESKCSQSTSTCKCLGPQAWKFNVKTEQLASFSIYEDRNDLKYSPEYWDLDPRPTASEALLCLGELKDTLSFYFRPIHGPIVEPLRRRIQDESRATLNLSDAIEAMSEQKFNSSAIKQYLDGISTDEYGNRISAPMGLGQRCIPPTVQDGLEALSISSELLRQYPSATVPLRITNRSLCGVNWLPKFRSRASRTVESLLSKMTRPMALACLTTLESGGFNISTSHFERAFAISSGSSMYVSRVVLSDPADLVKPWAIKKITGNIGTPAVSIILSPELEGLKVAHASDDYRVLQHQPYDYRRENSFPSMTLTLSLTKWRIPVPTGPVGLIDQDIFLTEAVVSAHEGGKWYGDIDLLTGQETEKIVLDTSISCRCGKPSNRCQTSLTSIDTFEDYLELPETPSVFRARENWAARLAAVCIWKQGKLCRERPVMLVKEAIRCWSCFEQQHLSERDSGSGPVVIID